MLAAALSKNSYKELIFNYLIGRKPRLITLRSSLHHIMME